jgi:hypothetical protein
MEIETNSPNSSIWDAINSGNNSSFWMTYNEIKEIDFKSQNLLNQSEFFEQTGIRKIYELYNRYLIIKDPFYPAQIQDVIDLELVKCRWVTM